MKKQYLVLGLGRFGSSLAITLCRQGAEVLAVDRNMDTVEEHRSLLTEVIQADAMDKSVLEEIGVENFDMAIVTIGSDVRTSGTITMLLKEMGVKHVIAKADDEFHGRMLTKLGADKVIFPERDAGERIANIYGRDSVFDCIEIMENHAIYEIAVPTEWVGKSVREVNVRAHYGANILGIKKSSDASLTPNVSPEYIFTADSAVMVMGEVSRLKKLINK